MLSGACLRPNGGAPLATHRSFAVAFASLTGAYATAALWVGSRTWFYFDDFAFLWHVQRVEPWSWFDPAVVMERYWWPFYRPLGMESFYYLCHKLFGLEFMGFVVAAAAVIAGTALAVARIGSQLGFDARVAAAAALLFATRPEMTRGLYAAAAVHYQLALLFLAWSLVCFLRYLRGGQIHLQVVSAVLVGLGLLCNSLAAAAPGVFGLVSLCTEKRVPPRAAALRALRRAAPSLVTALALLGLRFGLVRTTELPPVYHLGLGPHVLRNVRELLANGFGGGWLALAAVVLSVLAFGAARRAQRTHLRWLAASTALCLGWIAIDMVPFVMIRTAAVRFAVVIAIPIALGIGAQLEGLRRAWAAHHPRAFDALLLLLLLAALPFGLLQSQWRSPAGAEAERLMALMAPHVNARSEPTRFYLLHRGDGLAPGNVAYRFRGELFQNNFARAVFFGRGAELRWLDLSKGLRYQPIEPPCVYLQLDADGKVGEVDGRWLRDAHPRVPADRCATRGAHVVSGAAKPPVDQRPRSRSR